MRTKRIGASDLDRFQKSLPLLAIIAALLGLLYNLALIFPFGIDLLHLLSYVDHLNSALIAFLVFVIISVCFEIILVSVLGGRSPYWFPDDGSNRFVAMLFLAFVLVLAALYYFQVITYSGLSSVLPLLFVTFTGFFFRRFLVSIDDKTDIQALVFSLSIASTFSVWLGLSWVWDAKQSESTKFVLSIRDSIVEAKGVKPFRDFSLVIDLKNNLSIVRTADIRKIESR